MKETVKIEIKEITFCFIFPAKLKLYSKTERVYMVKEVNLFLL